MAWPSSSKASTQYTDSPTDRIADARAEINQNISNVNDIIDILNISSPTDGDMIRYSSSTGKWEKSTDSAIQLPATFTSAIGLGGDYLDKIENIVGNNYRRLITSLDDTDSIVTLDGDSAGDAFTFTLPAGTYLFSFLTNYVDTDDMPTASLYNITDDTSVISQDLNEVGTTGESIGTPNSKGITITASKTFDIRQNTASPSQVTLAGTLRFQVQKFR